MLQHLATVLFALICAIVQSVSCYDTSSDIRSLLLQPSYLVSVVSICSIVCFIVIILACTNWCPRETAAFKVVLIVY